MRTLVMNRCHLPTAVLALSVACEPLVDVKLTLVEPCNQRDRALSGVETLQVSHDAGEGDRIVLDNGGNGDPLVLRELADDVVVTVRAFESKETTGSPRSIGRSLPLDIEAKTRDLDLILPMGLVDTFGQTTDGSGACQFLDSGVEGEPGRHAHTATFLSGVNKVLIAGGAVSVTDPDSPSSRAERLLKSAELFDPATGTFEALPQMPNSRAYHTATALPDGRVFIAGGFGIISGEVQTLTTGLLYDPSGPQEDPWEVVVLNEARALHTATLLERQNLVVIIGGCKGAGCRPTGVQGQGGDPTALTPTIETFDVARNESVAQPNVLTTGRALHAASALEGGRLLVSGGVNAGGPVCDVEVFETSGNTLAPIPLPGSRFSSCPSGHAQVTLDASRVMFIGGRTSAPGGTPQGNGVATVQFWNTAAGIEGSAASLLSGRYDHAAALLDDGSVLVMGGVIAAGGASAERLVPQGSTFAGEALTAPLQEARALGAVTPLPNNQVMFSGGLVEGVGSSDLVEIYYGR